jgi:hypothetical protein
MCCALGKDGSRAFATGDFTPTGLTDDVSGLEPTQCAAIANWVSFYEKENKVSTVYCTLPYYIVYMSHRDVLRLHAA